MERNCKNTKVLEMARELSTAIVTSEAYRYRDLAWAQIKQDTCKVEVLQEYMGRSEALQIKRLQGVPVTFEDEASLSLLYSDLCASTKCKAYLDAESRLAEMLAKVYEIFSSSIKYP